MSRTARGIALTVFLAAVAGSAQAADVINGSRIYRMHCASCHGMSGISPLPSAPSFARGERMLQPDTALLMSIRRGRGAMPSFFGVLNDRETLDVVAYMRTLR